MKVLETPFLLSNLKNFILLIGFVDRKEKFLYGKGNLNIYKLKYNMNQNLIELGLKVNFLKQLLAPCPTPNIGDLHVSSGLSVCTATKLY